MKTAIFLVGNVCAGKSTLAEAWAQRHPEYQVVDLDVIRKQIFERERGISFTTKMENEAQEVAMDMVRSHHYIVFPTLGVSQFYVRVKREADMRFERVAKFQVFATEMESMRRIQERVDREGFRPHAFVTDPVKMYREYQHFDNWKDGTLLIGTSAPEANLMKMELYLKNL